MMSTAHASARVDPMAAASLAASALTLACLAGLHVFSPEFDLATRMISEFALGEHGMVLTAFFLCWALSSWTLALALWPHVDGARAKIGLAFLIAAGVGEAMAAVFDIRQPLHGVASLIGVPSLPVAAMLLSARLAEKMQPSLLKTSLLTTAQLTWITVLLMAVAMGVFFSTLPSTGTPDAGTVALQGYANRLLAIAYCAWAITAALAVMRPDRV